MKSFLAFFLILALTSATYTPTWTQCGRQGGTFIPKNVIVQQDSRTENNTLVAACGVVKTDPGWFIVFKRLDVNGTDGQEAFMSQVPYHHVVQDGLSFCLNFTSAFGNNDIPLRITAINNYGNEAGCVDIVLKYSESKFLFPRI